MQSVSTWRPQPIVVQDQAPPLDAELVRAATSADGAIRAAAFDALYRRYAERVYAYLRARTNTREDAADLTQQVFLHALEGLPRYQYGGTPFAAWLFRIARNCAVSFHRRAHHMVAWDLLPVECHPRTGDTADCAALANEDLAYLRALLAPLPAEAREMLALRFAAGLSAPEIAAVLGKGEEAVKKRPWQMAKKT